MFEIIKSGSKFDFVGKRYLWLAASAVTIIGSIALLGTKGLNYGIDFTGGAEVHVKAPADWDIGKLRAEMEAGGIKGLKIVQLGQASEHEFLIKAQGDEKSLNQISAQVEDVFKKDPVAATNYSIQKVNVVGPAAGGELRKSGFLSMLYALLCILIYVTIRFDIRYSPGAVLALFHDTLITLGIFVVMQIEFDLQILAAILALIGYSNNDTIIVFDRVRETLHQNPGMSITEAVNKSINETLGRTILTSLSTFISVFALWALGGKVIENFAFTLMVGLVVGTYSSVFIASSTVIFLTEYQERKSARQKANGRAGHAKAARAMDSRPEPKLN
ncbi:MAG: protein translocase subunit SecF [Bdellovibrionota bacterium]